MDLKQLRSFISVAEAGSFSAAARDLGYTQPAISQHVAALEASLGTQLLDRLPRSVRLTDAGQSLLVHARAITDRMKEAEADIRAISGLEGGVVRLAAIPSAGASLVPLVSAEFRQAYPKVEIELSLACNMDGGEEVAEGRADIVLQVESELGRDPVKGVEKIGLFADPFYLVMPADHPSADQPVVELADFADATWIADDSPDSSCPDGAIARRACEQAGFVQQVAFRSDDYGAIQGFISAGGGIALIPGLAIQSLRGDLVARPVAGEPAVRRMVAYAPAPDRRRPATAALLDTLLEVSAGFHERLPIRELARA